MILFSLTLKKLSFSSLILYPLLLDNDKAARIADRRRGGGGVGFASSLNKAPFEGREQVFGARGP